MELLGLILGILFIILAVLGLIILFVSISDGELGDAILAVMVTAFFSFLGIIFIKSYLHSEDTERIIKCSEYRIEEQITYSTDSIVGKTYIIYYKNK